MPLTSTLLPIDTNDEMPAWRRWASAAMAIPTPPDCEAMAIPPGANAWLVNVALSPQAVDTTPRQLGPTMRMPCRRAAASTSSCMRSPSAPSSANPAETTTAVGTPAVPHSRDDLGHRRGGDGDDRQVGHRVELVERATASTPPTTPAVGCTTLTRPLNDSRRWARIRRPGDVSSRPAPITTTCDGLDERPQRPHHRPPVAQVGVVLQEVVGGQVELDVYDAVLEPVPWTSPTVRNTPCIAAFPGKLSATRRRNPAARAIIARSSSRTVATPSWWWASATANATSASSPPGRRGTRRRR